MLPQDATVDPCLLLTELRNELECRNRLCTPEIEFGVNGMSLTAV